ncbi:hypothetical protein [Methylobacterium durans]|uniref:Uncharacterized protein n=1 Tax=Methylobacterium durans TaxID=2202825 RepID=A0A2U8WB90_9HYPH|nr:hypothetical protein [Methylobacterium durans]AWN42562.1 hypothetical protein DK389_21210 [Methylobacterium durans]
MFDVDQNEAAFTFDLDEEDELVTYGVGPCIAIAVVNQTQAWAGLCHYDNVHHRTPDLRGFLSAARQACEPGDAVEVWFGGGDNTDPETADEVNRAREAAQAAVQAYFPLTQQPLWLDAGGAYTVIVSATSADIAFELAPDDWSTGQ